MLSLVQGGKWTGQSTCLPAREGTKIFLFGDEEPKFNKQWSSGFILLFLVPEEVKINISTEIFSTKLPCTLLRSKPKVEFIRDRYLWNSVQLQAILMKQMLIPLKSGQRKLRSI
jgi:hypothetical protein